MIAAALLPFIRSPPTGCRTLVVATVLRTVYTIYHLVPGSPRTQHFAVAHAPRLTTVLRSAWFTLRTLRRYTHVATHGLFTGLRFAAHTRTRTVAVVLPRSRGCFAYYRVPATVLHRTRSGYRTPACYAPAVYTHCVVYTRLPHTLRTIAYVQFGYICHTVHTQLRLRLPTRTGSRLPATFTVATYGSFDLATFPAGCLPRLFYTLFCVLPVTYRLRTRLRFYTVGYYYTVAHCHGSPVVTFTRCRTHVHVYTFTFRYVLVYLHIATHGSVTAVRFPLPSIRTFAVCVYGSRLPARYCLPLRTHTHTFGSFTPALPAPVGSGCVRSALRLHYVCVARLRAVTTHTRFAFTLHILPALRFTHVDADGSFTYPPAVYRTHTLPCVTRVTRSRSTCTFTPFTTFTTYAFVCYTHCLRFCRLLGYAHIYTPHYIASSALPPSGSGWFGSDYRIGLHALPLHLLRTHGLPVAVTLPVRFPHYTFTRLDYVWLPRIRARLRAPLRTATFRLLPLLHTPHAVYRFGLFCRLRLRLRFARTHGLHLPAVYAHRLVAAHGCRLHTHACHTCTQHLPTRAFTVADLHTFGSFGSLRLVGLRLPACPTARQFTYHRTVLPRLFALRLRFTVAGYTLLHLYPSGRCLRSLRAHTTPYRSAGCGSVLHHGFRFWLFWFFCRSAVLTAAHYCPVCQLLRFLPLTLYCTVLRLY